MKRYGKTQALAGQDLVVNPGRVVALLGPNGAGKTTFVRAVATLLRPDAGTLHVDGIDALRKPARVRQVIGVLAKIGRDPRVDVPQHRAYVAVDDGSSRLMDALRALDARGIAVEDVSLRRPTLDEVFLALTGKPAQTTDTSEQTVGA
jgi:ABC-type phosphate/phosphonate transport system ATPase subunit